MAITSAIDFNEAFIVPTGGERAVRQRDFGDKLFGVAGMPDAASPGLAPGLRTGKAPRGKQALAALADPIHLIQHLIVLLHIRLECLLVKANIATTSSASANSTSSRRG